MLAGIGGHCPRCVAERPFKEVLREELDKNPFFITENPTLEEKSTDNKARRNNQMYQSTEGSTRLNETSLLEPSSLMNLSLSLRESGVVGSSPPPANKKAIKIENETPRTYNLPPTENAKFD